MKKVIYVHSDYVEGEFDIDFFEKLSDEEKLHIAKNSNDIDVYSLEGFQWAFNHEEISDLGFIYIINI